MSFSITGISASSSALMNSHQGSQASAQAQGAAKPPQQNQPQSAAQPTQSDLNNTLMSIQEAFSLGVAHIDIAYSNVTSAIEIVGKIRSKIVEARHPRADLNYLRTQISKLQKQLDENSLMRSAPIDGRQTSSTLNAQPSELVSSFERQNDGSIQVETHRLDGRNIARLGDVDDVLQELSTVGGKGDDGELQGIIKLTPEQESAQDEAMIAAIDKALDKLLRKADVLANAKGENTVPDKVVEELMRALDKKMGLLVEEKTKTEPVETQAREVHSQLNSYGLPIVNSQIQATSLLTN